MYSKNALFNFFLWGILCGIWTINILEDLFLSLYLLAVAFLICTSFLIYFRKVSLIVILLITGSILWIIYGNYFWGVRTDREAFVERYVWEYIPMTWEVTKLYKRSDFYDEYVLNLHSVTEEKVIPGISHILRIPKNFSLTPWQQVSYSGKIYPLEDFDGFAYKKYMMVSGIYFSTSAQTFETLRESPSNLSYYLYTYREKLLAQIARIFPSEEAIFLWGILFWARENIPADLKEDFNNSGLTHFIAVSGFNITLCVIFVTFIFGFLPMLWRIIMVSVTIIGFSFFVWLGAPVVRAAIMWVLWYTFLQSGNNPKNITILLFAAVCMVLYSPLSLNYDVSMHLSFLAVVGIIYTQDFFSRVFWCIPSLFAVREAFVLTLASLSFTLPIMMFQFGQVSLLAPFANIAVTWTIPLAMLLWAATLIMDSFSSLLWSYLWFITWILLEYDIMMVRFFGNIDAALLKVDFGPYAMYLQTVYFIILTYIICLFRMKKKD